MRAEGLRVKVHRRGRPTTTDSRHPHPVAANVLARRFAVTEVAVTDRVWAGSITYVPTREGWLYLAVILDLASRKVIGWSMQATLEVSLALAALEMALEARCPASGVLHRERSRSAVCGLRLSKIARPASDSAEHEYHRREGATRPSLAMWDAD